MNKAQERLTFESLMNISKTHALDLFVYAHRSHPFTALSDRASHESITHHVQRLDDLEEALEDMIDAWDTDDTEALKSAVERARELVCTAYAGGRAGSGRA